MSSSGTFPQWKGFERKPDGTLLDQIVDMERPLGLAYERSCGFYKDFHIHSRLMFVFPRGGCRMEVRTEAPSARFSVDQRSVLVVPPHISHDDEGKSTIYDTMALFPSEDLLSKAAESVGSPEAVRRLSARVAQVKRSSWLDHAVQEYFFRRVVAKTASPSALDALELEITGELLRAFIGKGHPERERHEGDTVAVRAIKYIETHLFEPMTLDSIAKNVGASVSTLTRALRAATRQTPYVYIRTRRLDEARALLQKGTHTVGEVALLVGYENFGAFSEAYKERFRKSPSRHIPKRRSD